MRDAIVGLGLVAFAVCVAACSGASDSPAVASDDVTAANPTPGDPATPGPTAPASPLPAGLQLDGGSPDATAAPPVDPGFRTMWAVDDANRLVRFTSTAPGTVTTLALTGLAAGERVLAIDFRPSNGKLYALGTTSRLYTIDTAKGTATAVGAKAFAPSLAGSAFGFDVNPVADKVRVHSDFDQNLRLDPAMGTATTDGTLAFTAGDPNEGQSPNLIATAYTNSVSPAPTATTLYAIDSTRNLLTKLATPNDGKVTTVGALGVDVTDVAGFDIWGSGSALQAYALLMSDGKMALFTIDLAKGTATLVGPVGHPSAIRGLAIEP